MSDYPNQDPQSPYIATPQEPHVAADASPQAFTTLDGGTSWHPQYVPQPPPNTLRPSSPERDTVPTSRGMKSSDTWNHVEFVMDYAVVTVRSNRNDWEADVLVDYPIGLLVQQGALKIGVSQPRVNVRRDPLKNLQESLYPSRAAEEVASPSAARRAEYLKQPRIYVLVPPLSPLRSHARRKELDIEESDVATARSLSRFALILGCGEGEKHGLEDPAMVTVHKDRNKLNFRKENLLVMTRAECRDFSMGGRKPADMIPKKDRYGNWRFSFRHQGELRRWTFRTHEDATTAVEMLREGKNPYDVLSAPMKRFPTDDCVERFPQVLFDEKRKKAYCPLRKTVKLLVDCALNPRTKKELPRPLSERDMEFIRSLKEEIENPLRVESLPGLIRLVVLAREYYSEASMQEGDLDLRPVTTRAGIDAFMTELWSIDYDQIGYVTPDALSPNGLPLSATEFWLDYLGNARPGFNPDPNGRTYKV